MAIDITSASAPSAWVGECVLSDPVLGKDSFRIRRLSFLEIAYSEEEGKRLYEKHVQPEEEHIAPLYILHNTTPIPFSSGVATSCVQLMLASGGNCDYSFEQLVKMAYLSDQFCTQIVTAAAQACGLTLDANGKVLWPKPSTGGEENPLAGSKKGRRRASQASGSSDRTQNS